MSEGTSSDVGPSKSPESEAAPANDLARAEMMVDAMARSLSDLASRIGQRALRVAARAREDAEDIWAEAEHLSRDPHAR